MSTIVSHLPLIISETLDTRLGSKGPPIGNGLRGMEWSHDR